jgi:nitrite reductase/ring-hydroxylating ferredoxin subunit
MRCFYEGAEANDDLVKEYNAMISHLWVCHTDELSEGAYRRLDVTYAGEASSVIVFRFQGQCLGYRNLCVHMDRALDCERDMIFDDSGQKLRCSMHGIVYDPVSGESLSVMCNRERLTPIKVIEDDSGIWIQDKRVEAIDSQ